MDFERRYYEAQTFWVGDALADAENARRYRETAELIPADARTVLDVGCGNGRFGAALNELRPDLTVVNCDRSQQALAIASPPSLQADGLRLPVADRSFDSVTCLEMIEHLPIPVYDAVLRELTRVARTTVIIGVPYNEPIDANTTTCPECRTVFNIDLHLRTFDDTTMSRLLSEHGFALDAQRFPGSREQLAVIAPAWNKLNSLRRGTTNEFDSPICPVCGYERPEFETDPSVPEDASPAGNGLRSRVVGAVKKVWPTQFVPGYWVVGRYTRTSDATDRQR